MRSAPPAIVSSAADDSFRASAIERGVNPDGRWVGGYVDYEWSHSRYVFEALPGGVGGRAVLEFGCNYGATSIVLAALGARVTAVDVDAACVRLAELNAARYGLEGRIAFERVADTSRLPFATASFDLVTCNSVLEYVPHDRLADVRKEIDRVLRPDGIIVILGTSNRLWPREIHSRRWFANYLPRGIERLWGGVELQRGVFPWQITSDFGRGYENLDYHDGGRAYLETRTRMRAGPSKRFVLGFGQRIARLFGTSVGLFTPSISVMLRKRSA